MFYFNVNRVLIIHYENFLDIPKIFQNIPRIYHYFKYFEYLFTSCASLNIQGMTSLRIRTTHKVCQIVHQDILIHV
jgi:hypothetical protein